MRYRIYIILSALFIAQGLTAAAQKWEKSGTRTWQGRNKIFYRLNETCSLFSSPDGNHWIVSADRTWEGQDGQWYKVGENNLLASRDGNNWKPSPDGKWSGFDGNSYRLDDNCTLMVMKQADMGKAEEEGSQK